MKHTKKKHPIRSYIQILFFILILLISINHTLAESGGGIPFVSNASLHAVCPFGGVVTLYQFFSIGTYVQKIHSSALILMFIALASAILFGSAFCSWICPFGTFQEWIGKIGRKLFKKRYNSFIPPKIDSLLRYLRYAILAWVLYMTASTGKLIFEEYDPYSSLFNLWTSEAALSGIILLGAVILLGLFIERPWCKYACPYGAVLGLFNMVRIFKIRRNETQCISCSKCSRDCPMNINVAAKKTVQDHQCIGCLQCVSGQACPVENTVKSSFSTKSKGISLAYVGVGLIVLFAGAISISMTQGVWQTTSTKVPAQIKTGEYEGQYDPSDIRGSYSFEDISKTFGIPAEDLTKAFHTEESGPKTQVKTLEAMYSDTGKAVGTDSVRYFVALYTNLPFTPGEEIFFPDSALTVLREKQKITEEQYAQLKPYSIPAVSGTSAVKETEEADTDTSYIIKGKTNFKEVLDMGLTKEAIEEVLGQPMPNPLTLIKDFCSEKGLDFQTVKNRLQEKVSSSK